MSAYTVIVRTPCSCTRYTAIARSSCDACQAAADLFSDVPCGISIKPLLARPQ